MYEKLESDIKFVLYSIYDPEIPVNIYDLGLIYDIIINEENDVTIIMTLTSPNCPVAEELPKQIEQTIKEQLGIKKVEVKITFDPQWTVEKMSEIAKLELGFFE